MKTRISIFYTWFVRITTCWMPDIPPCMRFRGFLYSLMLKECGRNLQVPASVILNPLTGISIGHNVKFGYRAIMVGTNIIVEDEAMVGPNSFTSGGNHPFYKGSYRWGKSQTHEPVRIKKGTWIGANCVITGGSVLPERSILAAGSVLTKAFDEPDCIYGGVPAKFIKKLIRDEVEA